MLHWRDEDHGTIGGMPFRVVRSDYDKAKTTKDEIVVLKGRSFFEHYANLLPAAPQRVLEVGFFQGGSTLIFAAMWPQAKIVGIDTCKRNDAVAEHIGALGFGGRIELHHHTHQTDKEKILSILDNSLKDVDLVIDDASHEYELSARTFDIAFPKIVPGGSYVLEDWGWAHWRSWQVFAHYAGKPALSNLLWELTMAAATSPDIIQSVFLNNDLAIVRKTTWGPPLPSNFTLKQIYTARGKNIETLI